MQVDLLTGTLPAPTVSQAIPSDIAQGRKFLSQLPLACAGSSFMYTGFDGTVIVVLKYKGNNKAVYGKILIKNGLVRQVY